MAQTINGIIATENYSEDFLSDTHWKGFLSLAKKTRCFIVGRKTYEAVKKWKDYTFDTIKAAKIVVSKNKQFTLSKAYVLAHSPKDALEKAKKLGFQNVLLAGGGTLNSAFLKKMLIDEIIISVEPCALGKGIKIFSEENVECKLKLLEITKLKEGIVQLHYDVIKKEFRKKK